MLLSIYTRLFASSVSQARVVSVLFFVHSARRGDKHLFTGKSRRVLRPAGPGDCSHPPSPHTAPPAASPSQGPRTSFLRSHPPRPPEKPPHPDHSHHYRISRHCHWMSHLPTWPPAPGGGPGFASTHRSVLGRGRMSGNGTPPTNTCWMK